MIVRLSILVISRTPNLLNEMLLSLAKATTLPYDEIEILCSWNGLPTDESKIINKSGYEFLIAKRQSYHFAKNMNSLAEVAIGDIFLLINDDIILDKGSLDSAIKCLEEEPNAGLVGGRLRDNNQKLTHAGITFDRKDSPYHKLDRLIDANSQIILGRNRILPAVTGALMLLKGHTFLSIRFNETFKVCGEDVELCLDLREKLELEVFYCPDFSAIHKSEQTRQSQDNQKSNEEDLVKLRVRRRKFLGQATRAQILNELLIAQREIEGLRVTIDETLDIQSQMKSSQEIAEEQTHSLHLSRISLTQEVSKLKKELALLNADRLKPKDMQKN